MRKVLITGAGGFVGKAIVELFSKKEFQIYRLLNKRVDSDENIRPYSDEENTIREDISEFTDLKNSLKIADIDIVIHAAGLAHQFAKQIKEEFWRVNVKGTENIAKLAVLLKAKHFILISSVSVYGKIQTKYISRLNDERHFEVISENANCHPKGFYAQSKLEGEKIARRICEENKIALTILRLATVVGEHDRGNVARLIESIDKKRFIWIGKGENFKSLIYKGDVARACLQVLDKTDKTEVFNVTAEPVKMKWIVSLISRELNRKIPVWKISPDFINILFRINSKFIQIKKIKKLNTTIEKWLSDDVFSGEKFRRKYEFQAKTPIDEALKRQIESYKQLKISR